MPPRRASVLQKDSWRNEFTNCPPPFLGLQTAPSMLKPWVFSTHLFFSHCQNTKSGFPNVFSIKTGSHRSFYHAATETPRYFWSSFWHQSEARTAATVWNWSGKTLSPEALLAVLYFFVPYFTARLDFLSPPLSAPGSPRMITTIPLFAIFWTSASNSYNTPNHPLVTLPPNIVEVHLNNEHS